MNRHFKKYYFYFLARLFDFLGEHDKSFASYAKVIRFRTFFWDVQDRYIASYQKSSKNAYLEIHGGIGDFLQHLPFILKNKSARYIVVTHFKDAQLFFKVLGIKIQKYYFYATKEEYREIQKHLRQEGMSHICPRSLFFQKSPFKINDRLKNNPQKLIGIHMGASAIGSTKAIPANFILKLTTCLLQKRYKIILFGTKEELSTIKIPSHKNIMKASYKDVIKNLTLVESCDFLVGSDSAFKTMSAMLKIPTMVLHHNSPNNFRDRVFIQPYIRLGIMHVYRYTNFNRDEMKTALHSIMDTISLNVHAS